MTTVAMGAGMLPIALGIGRSDPSFAPWQAWPVIIGGLITSTFLSLLRSLWYLFTDDVRLWALGWMKRKAAA